MSSVPSPAGAHGATAPPARAFDRIVCGVDGSAQGEEAVRQAAILGGPGTQLVLVSVACESGVAGAAWRPPLDPLGARHAVEGAQRAAAALGVRATARVACSPAVDAVLLREGQAAGLLVVAARAEPGRLGVGLGRLPTRLLHRARMPLLIVRRPPPGTVFPEPVVVARGPGHAAERVLADIAGRNGAGTVVAGDDGAPDALVERACRAHAALIVIAARPGGDAARVAQRAPCSVLVVPGPPAG